MTNIINKCTMINRAQSIPFSCEVHGGMLVKLERNCHPVGGKTLELKAETVFQELWLTLPVQGP